MSRRLDFPSVARAISPQATQAHRLSLWALGLVLVAAQLMIAMTAAQARPAPDGFADLAARLLPAVVNISTTQTITVENGPEVPNFPEGSPFREFFDEFFNHRGGHPDATPRRATSLGSGFIIDPAGYIVTNTHVIADADQVTVTLSDNRTLDAKIVGRDPKTDIALLKVEDDKPLPSVPWGDSDKARVGDWVMAIGNPFGLGGSVTAGIISARARDINAGPYDNFIQTDAAINRGNSGGPLFNMDGAVIGINTAIFSPSGGSVGIGFSVPSNLAKQVISDIKQYGRTRRGWLGVRIQTVTPEIADSLGLDKAKGALVASVNEKGPAQAAGIRAGDVVLSFNGHDIDEMRKLPRIVAETDVGSKVDVELWRDGKTVDVSVKLGELEEAEDAGLVADNTPSHEGGAKPHDGTTVLGMTVQAITPDLAKTFDLAEDSPGVVITDVNADSDAAEKGLRPGNVIVEVNQTPVSKPSEVTDALKTARSSGRSSVLLLVQRDGAMSFLALKLD